MQDRPSWTRAIALGGAGFLFVLVLLIDVARKNVAPTFLQSNFVVDVLSIGALFLLFPLLQNVVTERREDPLRLLLTLVIPAGIVFVIVLVCVFLFPSEQFQTVSGWLVPHSYNAVFLSLIIGTVTSVAALFVFLSLYGLLIGTGKRGTRILANVLVALLIVDALTRVGGAPATGSFFQSAFFIVAIVITVLLSFRLPWLIELRRKEKLVALGYELMLVAFLGGLAGLLGGETFPARSIAYFSAPLGTFTYQLVVLGCVYFTAAFAGTLFHLPTSDIYERRVAQISSLRDFGNISTQILDKDQLAQTVLKLAREIGGARGAWLEFPGAVVEGHGQAGWECLSENGALDAGSGLPFDELRAEALASSSVTLRGGNLRGEPKGLRRFMPKLAAVRNSFLAVPLRVHNETRGMLYLAKPAGESFDRHDIATVTALADSAAMALENSRLLREMIEKERLERELLLAQSMQTRLLPRELPRLPGIDLFATSIPATEVGGDYYDIVHNAHGNLSIVVGDVSGKGITAAFYMAVVKGVFQAVGQNARSPREFLVNANEALRGSLDSHSFVTMVHAIINPSDRTMSFARAGHCPIARVRDSRVELLVPRGMGLGLASDDVFSDSLEEVTVPCVPGDTYVFFTDGVTELRRPGGEEFGIRRMEELLRGTAYSSAEATASAVLQSLRQFAPEGGYIDDMTVLVLRFVGCGEVSTAIEKIGD